MASVAVLAMTMLPAAGSIIQRGIWMSRPSGPRTVMGSAARRGAETTSNSVPARG